MRQARLLALLTLTLVAGCALAPHQDEMPQAQPGPVSCPPPGQWVFAGEAQPLEAPALLDRIADARVILLGERHDKADDHRWQLHLLSAIHGRRDDMAVGFEMFHRDQQQALHRWVQGELSEQAFLEAVAWEQTWGYPAELYLPLFHFVRLHRIPAVALNIERELVRRISREGWDAIPLSERHQLRRAEPGPPAYDAILDDIMAAHTKGTDSIPEERKEAFRRAQRAWDKAMADAIAAELAAGRSTVVGILGRGHMQWGYGVPYQLREMGIDGIVTLLPFNPGDACLDAEPAPADALFGLPDLPSGEKPSGAAAKEH